MARDRKEYLVVRSEREGFLNHESDAYDKAVLQISAATIGVSLVVLDKIAAHPPIWLSLIVFAWVALVLSMVCVVTSYLVNSMKFRKEIRNLDLEQEGEPPTPTDKYYYFRGHKFAFRGQHLSSIAGCSLYIGVVLVLLFAILNVRAKTVKSSAQGENTNVRPHSETTAATTAPTNTAATANTTAAGTASAPAPKIQ